MLHLRPIAAKPEGPWRRGSKWVRRKPVHAALLATLAVSLPIVGLVVARAVVEARGATRTHIADLLDEARWLGEREAYRAMLERAEAVLAIEPDHPIALRHRAMARFMGAEAKGDSSAANKLRQEALDDASRVASLLPRVAWPRALKAYMLEAMGRKGEAAAEAEQAERLRGSTPSDDDLGEEARLAQARGESERALSLYSELIRRHPDSVRAVAWRALIHEKLGNPESASVDYRVAAGLDPSYDLVLIDLARLSADGGHLDDAEAHLGRALALDPKNAFALEVRGRILADRGREARSRGDLETARRLFEEAARTTQAALVRSDDLVWAELNLAAMISERAKLAESPDAALMARAIDGYRQVLDKYRTRPAGGQERDVYDAALLNICDAQITMRRLQEALATCSNITELHAENAVAYYNLAGVYALMGRRREALEALERDLELGDVDADYLAADPWFTDLRTDPRFVAILDEMRRRREKVPPATQGA